MGDWYVNIEMFSYQQREEFLAALNKTFNQTYAGANKFYGILNNESSTSNLFGGSLTNTRCLSFSEAIEELKGKTPPFDKQNWVVNYKNCRPEEQRTLIEYLNSYHNSNYGGGDTWYGIKSNKPINWGFSRSESDLKSEGLTILTYAQFRRLVIEGKALDEPMKEAFSMVEPEPIQTVTKDKYFENQNWYINITDANDNQTAEIYQFLKDGWENGLFSPGYTYYGVLNGTSNYDDDEDYFTENGCRKITVAEALRKIREFTNHSLNKNQNYDTGKVILCTKVITINRGQSPKGTRITGKESKTATVSGHVIYGRSIAGS